MNLVAHAAWLEPSLTVVKPAGPGPFPVCLQFHGCGGVMAVQRRYAETACAAGVAGVVVDSLGPRGIGRREAQATICTGLRFRGAERAADVVAMLRWLEDQPWADIDQVALAGWSHGAWAIMEALAMTPRASALAVRRVKGAILFYPYSGPLSRTRSRGWGPNRPRVHALIGGRDAVVGETLPRRALARLQQDGIEPTVLYLKEATHGFDDADGSDPRSRYRPDLAEQALDFYAAALRDCLSGARIGG